MDKPVDFNGRQSLHRILPRIRDEFEGEINQDLHAWNDFEIRLNHHFADLFSLYYGLYHHRYDFFYHLENLVRTLAASWVERPNFWKETDKLKGNNPHWFQSNNSLGGVIYIDLFAGDIKGVINKIPYFKELGLTYLHLMPFFEAPEGENDGGYAVSSYRDVDPKLGTMHDLQKLAQELNKAGISLVVDLVFNHTSNKHRWAQVATDGSVEHQDLYHIYQDRRQPDQYEQTLREIFPDEHSGSFTFFPEIKFSNEHDQIVQKGAWVWTTFHSYQWDLNYANPNTFNLMAAEMLFLANQGVEVIRLDAVAFIWKEVGTGCENLPQAHQLIRAFNKVARISAPSLLFKSEAIVHPDDVVKYIDPAECQLSYNPLIMALLWNTLATREVNLLNQALTERFSIDPKCAWVNYVRCHDDIGWTFADDDAIQFGINGYNHRRFLNDFFLGRFDGSFAMGVPFQENPKTGDCRISGTCASLAGLEKAVNANDPLQVEFSIRRILLLHAIILTIGGIPLIYLGDEVATLNDHSYHQDVNHSRDSRWIHRPAFNDERYKAHNDTKTIPGRVFNGLQALIQLRKDYPAFSGGNLKTFSTGNKHILGYERWMEERRLVILANFSEFDQSINSETVADSPTQHLSVLHGSNQLPNQGEFSIRPYDFVVLG